MSPRHDTRHDIPKAVSPCGTHSGFISSWLPKLIGVVGKLPLGISWLHPRAPLLSPHPFRISSASSLPDLRETCDPRQRRCNLVSTSRLESPAENTFPGFTPAVTHNTTLEPEFPSRQCASQPRTGAPAEGSETFSGSMPSAAMQTLQRDRKVYVQRQS